MLRSHRFRVILINYYILCVMESAAVNRKRALAEIAKYLFCAFNYGHMRVLLKKNRPGA